jgi:Leucine Rich repeat
MQPGLQSNRTLRELNLFGCAIGDEGIRLIADALVGNTTMDALGIGMNDITFDGLDDITRLLESPRLKKLDMQSNYTAIRNEASTQRFATVLTRHEFLMKLDISQCELGNAGLRIIARGLVGNTTMESLNISWNDLTSDGLDDITRLVESTRLQTIDFQHAGASAIFKLFTARPQLLEKRLPRPAAAAATTTAITTMTTTTTTAAASVSQAEKRRAYCKTLSSTHHC